MSTYTPVSDGMDCFLPTEVEGFAPLAELALDLRWSWNHCADNVWRQLDPALWERTQNPWVVLQTVSRDKLKHMLADPAFRKRVDWEASGTSGMKVLVNGGINLSELDGWWAEAYTPEVGWAVGDGREHGDDPAWDAVEADSLYDLLEREVIPEFYTRDESGIPTAWVKRMRESMARLTPRFSANRAVREYTEQHYVPAASAYRQRGEQRRNGQASGRLAACVGSKVGLVALRRLAGRNQRGPPRV